VAARNDDFQASIDRNLSAPLLAAREPSRFRNRLGRCAFVFFLQLACFYRSVEAL
jgi:hypothetical protein